MTSGKLTKITNHLREQVQRENPKAVSLKTWRMMQAEKEDVSEEAVRSRYYYGGWYNPKIKRLNARVVLVLNP